MSEYIATIFDSSHDPTSTIIDVLLLSLHVEIGTGELFKFEVDGSDGARAVLVTENSLE